MLTQDQREVLLDFDEQKIHRYSRKKADELLNGEHAALYEAQLVTARHLDSWRESQMRELGSPMRGHPPAWYEGFEYAMEEIAAHLRKGDYLPGCTLYQQGVIRL